MGTAQNAFGYQVLAAAREALGQHPNQGVRSLHDVEAKLGVRLVLGGPPVAGGRLDVDGVGVQPWRTVLYAMGQDVRHALDFVHLVLEHKVRKGAVACMPHLGVHLVGQRAQHMAFPKPVAEGGGRRTYTASVCSSSTQGTPPRAVPARVEIRP